MELRDMRLPPLDARDRAIVLARAQGDSLREIAVRFGISREWARQILARNGAADPESAKRARAEREEAAAQSRRDEVLAAFRKGDAVREIARRLGLPHIRVATLIASHATSRDRAARRVSHSTARRAAQSQRFADETLVESVRQVVEKTGRVPTATEYAAIARTEGLPSISTVENRWGGWNAALRAAGITPVRPDRDVDSRRWTEARCLEALDRLVAETGAFPSRGSYEALSRGRDDLPCVATLVKRLGTWSQITLRVQLGLGAVDEGQAA